MNTSTHLIVGGVGAYLLALSGLDTTAALAFFAWSVLIDLDHILYFIINDHAHTPKQWLALAHHYHDEMQANLYAFHGPEFLLLTIALSTQWPVLWGVVLATLTHTLMDVYTHYQHFQDFSWYTRWSVTAAWRDRGQA